MKPSKIKDAEGCRIRFIVVQPKPAVRTDAEQVLRQFWAAIYVKHKLETFLNKNTQRGQGRRSAFFQQGSCFPPGCVRNSPRSLYSSRWDTCREALLSRPGVIYAEILWQLSRVIVISWGRVAALVSFGGDFCQAVCLDAAGCVSHLGCTVLTEHFAKLIRYKPHVVPLLAALESECADSKNWTSLEPIPRPPCSCGFRKESMTRYPSNPRWSVWQEVAKAVKYITGFGFLKAS